MALADQEKMILLERLDRAIEQGKRMRDRAKEETLTYVNGAETALTAGVIGYYEGRTGKDKLVDGLPLDFTVAAAMYGIGFFGVKRETAQHLYAVGNGGLAVYAYKWGREMGSKMAPAGTTATSGTTPQQLPAYRGGLSDTELSRLIDAARGIV